MHSMEAIVELATCQSMIKVMRVMQLMMKQVADRLMVSILAFAFSFEVKVMSDVQLGMHS